MMKKTFFPFYVKAHALALFSLFFLIPYLLIEFDFTIDSNLIFIHSGLIAILFALINISIWLANVYNTLHKKITKEQTDNLNTFNILISLPVTTLLLSLMLVSIDWPHDYDMSNSLICYYYEPRIVFILRMYIFPTLFFVSLFYCIFHIIKIIRTLELKRSISWKDFLLDFLLFIFLPIGIWSLQRKINRLRKLPDAKVSVDLSDHLLS